MCIASMWRVREERRRLAKQRDHRTIEHQKQVIRRLWQQLRWWQEWYSGAYAGDYAEDCAKVLGCLEADSQPTVLQPQQEQQQQRQSVLDYSKWEHLSCYSPSEVSIDEARKELEADLVFGEDECDVDEYDLDFGDEADGDEAEEEGRNEESSWYEPWREAEQVGDKADGDDDDPVNAGEAGSDVAEAITNGTLQDWTSRLGADQERIQECLLRLAGAGHFAHADASGRGCGDSFR